MAAEGCIFIDENTNKHTLYLIFENISDSYTVKSAVYKKISVKNSGSPEVDRNCPKIMKDPSVLKLEIEGEYDNSDSFEDSVTDLKEQGELTEEEIDILSNITSICFVDIEYIRNVSGPNKDTRGMKHNEEKLPWFEEIKLEKNKIYTLDEVAELYFKIKSHRFDCWYEMFGGAKIKDNKLLFNFDHGS
jgi:hypothetical protein